VLSSVGFSGLQFFGHGGLTTEEPGEELLLVEGAAEAGQGRVRLGPEELGVLASR
jgi:hypothetical protein